MNINVKEGGILFRIGVTLKINKVNTLITSENQHSLRSTKLTYENLKNAKFLPTLNLQHMDFKNFDFGTTPLAGADFSNSDLTGAKGLFCAFYDNTTAGHENKGMLPKPKSTNGRYFSYWDDCDYYNDC